MPKEELFTLLYQRYAEDIQSSKRQQWQLTYYVLLLQTALIGFYNLNGMQNVMSNRWKWILGTFSIIISIIGNCIICQLRCNIQRYQTAISGLEKLEDYLPKEIKKIIDNSVERPIFLGKILIELTMIILFWFGSYFVLINTNCIDINYSCYYLIILAIIAIFNIIILNPRQCESTNNRFPKNAFKPLVNLLIKKNLINKEEANDFLDD